MDRRDIPLVHCVEIVCPHCGHMVRVARCQCDLDAEHLMELYRREILLYDIECHHCDQPYLDPEAVRRVNRSREHWTEGIQDQEDEEDEAREMSTLDAILEARERDRETGYDGVRPDHSDQECRGGDA